MLECKVWRIIDLPCDKSARQCYIVIGEVVGINIGPDMIVAGKVDARRLKRVARPGYFEYLTVMETFDIARPVNE